MYFEIAGAVTHVETFASGSSIRQLPRLRKFHGRGPWRKRKGIARVRLSEGTVRLTEVHWDEAMESGAKSSRSSATSTEPMRSKKIAVCLRNDGYEVSLERRKICQVLPDPEAAKHRQVRVIDESGDDYPYPQKFFAPIKLLQPIRRAVLAAV